MKKLNPFFLILFSMLLVACGSAESEEQNVTSGSSPEMVSPNQVSNGANVANLPPGMVSLNYSRSFNYTRVSWSANYVQSAFLRVPTNYQFADPISFSQFGGQTNNPNAFAPVANETELLGKLADSPLSENIGSRPMNYCKIPRAGIQGVSSEECYTSNPNTTSYNYIDIPLSGTHSHAGLLKFRLPAHQNVFTIYYRDWANRLNKKEIKIAKPS
ncbi:MAG: hypothetical protein K8R69_00745 [Deltaproteobacteria bacterium]|nr:hypothetical protein [Deltaproteobacteria bacterium]